MKMYKYSMVKYIKMYSTWILLFVSIIINILISIVSPFVLKNQNWINYEHNVLVSVSMSFISIILSGGIYFSLKTSQIFKTEIEDGSFLILLSKPISRTRIFFEKWLAIFTLIVLYAFLNSFIYTLCVLIADSLSVSNPNSLSSNIWLAWFIAFLLEVLFLIIFSCITLIVSLKFSSLISFMVLASTMIYVPISSTFQIIKSPKYEKFNKHIPSLRAFNVNNETINYLNGLSSKFNDKKVTSNDMNSVINLWNSYLNKTKKENIGYKKSNDNPYEYIYLLDMFNILKQTSLMSIDKFDLSIPNFNSEEVVKEYLNKSKVLKDIETLMNELRGVIDSSEFKNSFYFLFDIILNLRKVPNIENPSNDVNYLDNLKSLIEEINNNSIKQGSFIDFIKSPLVSSIFYANNQELKIQKNVLEQILVFEKIVLLKLLTDSGFGVRILFAMDKIESIYYTNGWRLLKTTINDKNEIDYDESSKKIIDDFVNNINENKEFNELIWKYFSFNFDGFKKINKQSVVDIINLIMLEEKHAIPLVEFEYKDYIDEWEIYLFLIMMAASLFGASFIMFRKQNIR